MRAVNRLPGCFVFPAGGGAFKIGPRFIRMGMKGVSDLLGWRRHRLLGELPQFVALECKLGKDRLSPEQAAFLDKVREAGGIGLEIRSIEEAIKALS